MPNRLASETSPYLLQHANNPVDWYPWGREALERARAEQKPILLSVGYAACHWCHVMERESFEDEETARLMNENFVNIKVDREERPDIDAIYMQAVQAMTGHGGWPMTVVMTPEGVPFFGGTYFPPEPRHGMPSFRRVLAALTEAWRSRRDDVEKTVVAMRQLYAAASEKTASSGAIGPDLLEESYRGLVRAYDERHGGFGSAPKFPSAMALDALLRRWSRTGDAHALEMVTRSFSAMARGGIYDQVGGGFHRYSVDAEWLVPHFEKMLYDNALLVRLGTHIWLATGDGEAALIVEETIGWLAREMTSVDGGFYATMDADSEGEEGRFYVWSAAEFDSALGERSALMRSYWGVSDGGNFEGSNILHLRDDPRVVSARNDVTPDELARRVTEAKQVLYEARAQRTWPARDEKMIASWNALMTRALAEAARAFDRDDWRSMAVRAGEWLFSSLVTDGRVMHVHTAGATSEVPGLLDDHAATGLAALALYELTFDRAWLDRASRLAGSMVDHFWDDSVNAFFDTADDHEELVTRPREVTDNATPSGTSLAVDLLLRVSEVTQDADHRRRAGYVLETLNDLARRHPTAFGNLLCAADAAINGSVEVAIVGDPSSEEFMALSRTVAKRYFPALALAGGPEDGSDIPLLAGRVARGGRPTAYVCRNYTCDEPVSDPEALERQLDRISGGTSGERS